MGKWLICFKLYGLGNVGPMRYYARSKFESDMVNKLLLLLILRKTGIGFLQHLPLGPV